MFEERFNDFFEKNHDLNYRKETMYQMLNRCAEKLPKDIAVEFVHKKYTYKKFMEYINDIAKGLVAVGIRKGDVVTICMPNCPQAIGMFYAINRIGAISNVIHPLSAQSEIKFFLSESNSKAILTLDQFIGKVIAARNECEQQIIVIDSHISDELPTYLKLPYKLKYESQYPVYTSRNFFLSWEDFIGMGENYPLPLPKIKYNPADTAVILYSGGTTGTTKGIMLTDLNFNALSEQALVGMGVKMERGDSILAAMPIFHGFGLGIGIHTCICNGTKCILLPKFSVESYGRELAVNKPSFIAGVPTLFEAMLRTKGLSNANLSFLKGMYCGGDSLSIELKAKVDKFLKEHHANIQVCEGYGTTESCSANCLTPVNRYKPGSIGVPFPDTKFMICKPDTIEEVAVGEEGEICLSGPTVMLGYLNNEAETANVLKVHKDGNVYLHTGDLGKMDEDGYVYFKQRIKRMIITSGYNVYPSQIENIIDANPKVLMSCCIGVKDPYRIQKVKAFIILKPGVTPCEEMKEEILDYCKKHIAKYALPREIEFRDEFPRTKVGKIAYRELEMEEESK